MQPVSSNAQVSAPPAAYVDHCVPALEAVYAVGAEVGRGSCSVVRSVTHRESGEVFVAKFCAIQDSGWNPEEAEIIMSARHENIVRGIDVFVSATHSALVMEDLQRGGELFQLVSSSSTAASVPGLPEATVAKHIRCILSALQYLHDVMGVVHRDVKLENIMLVPSAPTSSSTTTPTPTPASTYGWGNSTSHYAGQQHKGMPPHASAASSGTVKLIDFGFSKRIGFHTKTLNACCGSPNYMSPEMLRATRTQDQSAAALPTKHQPYGNEVDLWATGVVMYVMLVGRYPFYHERRSVWHKSILLGQFHQIPSTVAISSEGRDLLSKLLTVRAEDRLTAEEALHHPWFRSALADLDEGGEGYSAGCRQVADAFLRTPIRKKTPPLMAASAAAAFTPPHNHALFVDTPMGKQPHRPGDYADTVH